MKTIQGRCLPPCGAHSRCLTYGSWYLPSSLVSLTTAALPLSLPPKPEKVGGGGGMGASGAALQPRVWEAVSPAAASTVPLWAGVEVLALGAPAYPASTSVPGTSQLPARVLYCSFITLRTQTVVGRPLAPCRQSVCPLYAGDGGLIYWAGAAEARAQGGVTVNPSPLTQGVWTPPGPEG